MIKDPLNPQVTPYDILDLNINTPMSEIHQSLIEFMKKNKVVSKISLAQEAVRKLKNIQDRISFDITYYAVDVLENNNINALCDISGLVTKLISIPVLVSPDYIKDILVENETDEIPQIYVREVKVENITRYKIQDKDDLIIRFEKIEPHFDN